jgi:hypothetical protein
MAGEWAVTVRGLILGLGFGSACLAAQIGPAIAEPGGWVRTAQSAPPKILRPADPRPQAQPARAEPPVTNAPTPEQVEAIARSQKCLAMLGYYKGEVDGKRGKETWTAFWTFKQEHDLKSYSDLLAEPVQQKLAELCQQKEEELAAAAARADPLYQPEDEAPPEAAETSDSADTDTADEDEDAVAGLSDSEEPEDSSATEAKVRLDIDCLPEDLAGVLQRAHGAGRSIKRCERICLPSPRGIPQAQLDEMQAKDGVVWCRACVPIKGNLALDDVRRIEQVGNLQLCATPPRQLPRYGEGATEGLRSYMRVRELYRALPPGDEDPDAYAVVIGNRSYDKLPRSVTSYNDADAMYAFLTEHLGYRPDNIIDLRDAKKTDFEAVFGAGPGVQGELARLVESQPSAKVLVYYSGHGATDEGQNEVYLLPVDGEHFREETDGYKLSTLYANLARLEAKSVTVLLETEYGRDHGPYVLPPNLPDMLITALPRSASPPLTVLAATDRGQRSLVDISYDIGLFTRYLIEGLAGAADLAPIGNGDGKVDTAELYVYAASFVDLSARKTFGLLQHPIYSSAATSVLTSARSVPSPSN